jgi:hypothetical protein
VNGRADFTCDLPCNCKFGFLGPYCDKCVDRYYGFPNCRCNLKHYFPKTLLFIPHNYLINNNFNLKHVNVIEKEVLIGIVIKKQDNVFVDLVTQA